MINNFLSTVILANAQENPDTSKKILGLPENLFFAFIALIVVLFLVALYLIYCFVIVKKNEQVVVERLGKYKKTVSNKWLFLIPFVDRIVYRSDMEKNNYYYFKNSFSIIDSKNKSFTVSLSVNYRIIDAQKFYYNGENSLLPFESNTAEQICNFYITKTISEIKKIRTNETKKLIDAINESNNEKYGVEISELFFNEIK